MSKKAPINTKYLTSLLTDVNFQGEISYDQLTVGRKLGSGGFKDCYAGKYMGVSRWYPNYDCRTRVRTLSLTIIDSLDSFYRRMSRLASFEFKTLPRRTLRR